MNLAVIYKLSARQWWWLFIAWWRIWGVSLRLKRSGIQWLSQQLSEQRMSTQTEFADQQRSVAERMHESVRLAARCHPLSVACLERSLVLSAMLLNRGVPATVCLGINLKTVGNSQPISSRLASHAWVELNGEPIAEPDRIKETFAEIKDANTQ